MNALRTLWGLLFRLFPCPTAPGLRAVGRPDGHSPVLVTGNFHLTVTRLTRVLERAGVDAWLLVVDSHGINVWCAAGHGTLCTDAVAAALKTSGLDHRVDHRVVLLPPLAAPAVCAAALGRASGWQPRWGPVRATDLPRFLAEGQRRTEAMKRVTWTWRERLDPALGTYFALLPLGALGLGLAWPALLPSFLVLAAALFLLLFGLAPVIPGRTGGGKALSALAAVVALGGLAELWRAHGGPSLRQELGLSAGLVLLYGLDLGGLAPHLRSGFDPFLARLGIRRLGNTRFAGTLRGDLLTGARQLTLQPAACVGCGSCAEVCPVGVWTRGDDHRARLSHRHRCTACTACLRQCEAGAIQALAQKSPAPGGTTAVDDARRP